MDRRAGTALAERVEAQHGVVTRLQLLAFGPSASAIDSRLRRGALRPLHVGVYAVGHTALRPEGRWLAGGARLWRRRGSQPPVGGAPVGHVLGAGGASRRRR